MSTSSNTPAITFFSAKNSSAAPVAAALIELGLAHEKVSFDLSARQHKQADYLRVNPNGTVPALLVDGAPLFEAVAILQYLAERFGVEKQLWPAAGDPKRLLALSWTSWAYVTYGSVVKRLHLSASEWGPRELRHQAHADEARSSAATLLALLDTQLEAQAGYVLGDTFTLVDLVLASVVGYSTYVGVDLAPHPHVTEWLARCQTRPSLAADHG